MQTNDLSKSLVVLNQDSTLVAVVELSLSNWLAAGLVPGLARQPLKKLGADPEALLQLVQAKIATEDTAEKVLAHFAGEPEAQQFLARAILRRTIDVRLAAAVSRVL